MKTKQTLLTIVAIIFGFAGAIAQTTTHQYIKAGWASTYYDWMGFKDNADIYRGGFLYKKSSTFPQYGTTGDFTVYAKNAPLTLSSSNGSRISLNPAGGNVGVGTFSPSYLLDVAGIANLNKGKSGIALRVNGSEALWYNGTYFSWGYGSVYNVFHDKVSIGTSTNPGTYMLMVDGKIRAKEIVVETGWSDFVFEKDYQLRSLEAVEAFIEENGHLPEIPSAKDVEENGVKVGEVESKLLMKIEELTLYIIEQNKRMKAQDEKIEQLTQKVSQAY